MPGQQRRQCVGVRKDGGPCGMAPLKGSDRCVNHAGEAEAVARRDEAGKRARLVSMVARKAAMVKRELRAIGTHFGGWVVAGHLLSIADDAVDALTAFSASPEGPVFDAHNALSALSQGFPGNSSWYPSKKKDIPPECGVPHSSPPHASNTSNTSHHPPPDGLDPRLIDRPPDEQIRKAVAKKPTAGLSQEQRSMFARFWAVYPRHEKRADAEKAWAKHAPDEELTRRIVRAIELQILHTWRDSDFIPHPTTWLNGRRWEDEIQTKAPITRGKTVELPRAQAAALRFLAKEAQREAMARAARGETDNPGESE